MTPLRLAFMGTPDFAVPALTALQKAGHTLVAVYCQPPKPAGRGQQLKETPVHRAALAMGLPVHTPRALRDVAEQEQLRAMKLDAIIVAAYGLILPQAVLDAPRLGCFNIHASLLPRWRGAAPIQRALLAGDSETGITIMQMAAGLDTGDMLLKDALPLTAESTAQSLHDDLAAMGARLILSVLEQATAGTLQPQKQDETQTTYAAKLTREDGILDWQQPAATLERKIRALTPWPGTFFRVRDEQIKVLRASVVETKDEPGKLLDDQFTVACGEKALRLIDVQRAGKKNANGAAVLRGMHISVGEKLS